MVRHQRWVVDIVYTADEYLNILQTFSGHRALEADHRRELLARLRRRIESRPGGSVRKSLLMLLTVARRV